MITQKRVIQLVPEIKGCYGPRVWVEASDQTLNNIFKILSVWPGPTLTKSEVIGSTQSYWYCYELSFGFLGTDVWRNLISRMNVIIKED